MEIIGGIIMFIGIGMGNPLVIAGGGMFFGLGGVM